MNKFYEANELINDPKSLRERAAKDGYLFFRRLIDPDIIRNVRGAILSVCDAEGWLAPGKPVMDGIPVPGKFSLIMDPDFMVVYDQVIKLQCYNEFAHQKPIMSMLETLFGEQVLLHGRIVCRIVFPQAVDYTTPAHQDFMFNGGTKETWTCWTPMGDCAEELGGLTLMPGSHKEPIQEWTPALGAGGRKIDTDKLPYEWASTDYQAGDTLFFHSHTIHKGRANVTPDRLRLSIDCRYQPASHPVPETALEPHHLRCTWEEVYKDWDSTEFQYYWKKLPPLNIIPEIRKAKPAMK